MATRQTQGLARLTVAPSVLVLFLWMIVPLAMTIYFSFLRYDLQNPDVGGWAGWSNYYYFITDDSFPVAVFNTLALVTIVVVASIVGGIALALLMDQPFWGRGIVRLLVISPFFVMPTVSALVWKNLLMHPIYGLFAFLQELVGLTPFDWFAKAPVLSVAIIVAWQWLPFATLILLTALQSLDQEQKDASAMDGARPVAYFRYIVLPHLARPITVVILIETIFLLNVFAEIYVTSVGGLAGNLTYLVYFQGLLNFDVGEASAGGLIAVILANIASFFLVRMIGHNLEA
jgi:sorbitol/mannitol transport system permease protein